MAVTIGTNAGFVSSAPSANPGGLGYPVNDDVVATKDTSPSGSNVVTQLGWYQSRGAGSDATSYNMGIYSHDAANNRPNVLITTQSSGASIIDDTEAWYTYSGLNIAIVAATIYWIAFGIDWTGSNNNFDYGAASSGAYAVKANVGPILPEPFGAPDASDTRAAAIYALYEAAAGGLSIPNPFYRPLMGPIGGPI